MPKVPRTRKHVNAVTDLVKSPKSRSTPQKNGTKSKSSCPEQQILEMLREKYSANRNTNNAVAMKQYMRGQFEFFGLPAPARRALDKEVLEVSPALEVENVRQLLHLLWQEKEREFQMFGVDYGGKNLKVLIGQDLKTSAASLECVKQLLVTQSWWDTVDMLASKLVGGLVAAHPEELGRVMDAWIEDDNMWVRRSAILHQLNYNKNTDQEKLFRYCLCCCHEKEFFIEKAIGWALRNYFRYNSSAVKKFVSANKDKLAKLSVREALKHA